MLVSGVGPCVLVVRDSVGGHAPPSPPSYYSGDSQGLEQVLFCACMWGWLCGAHNEDGRGGLCLRVGGVVRVLCLWVVGVLQGAC